MDSPKGNTLKQNKAGGKSSKTTNVHHQKFLYWLRSFLQFGKTLRHGGWKAVPWRNFLPGTDIGLATGVIILLSILIIPLPTFILDMGLSISITSSVLILMVALFLRTPLDFTSFPTLLLLTTLLRLSLEIATTRLILSHGNEGPYAAGHVVAAFGGFLMEGDVLIGGIVFCILLAVNFMVITKGSGRIAEVAARFSLDAMPGKQMAIDADLSSGAISEREARSKRKELEEESGFYGSMDGAAKFVRGDAIASVIITAINIIGGLTIGILRHNMPLSAAANTFTTLTIGDGLVSQIPALLVSTAAGIVVTKGGTEGPADVTLFAQLSKDAKPMAIASVLSAMFAMMPGLPTIPFLIISAIAALGAWLRHRSYASDDEGDVTQIAPQQAAPTISEILHLDLLRLELGFGLLTLTSGDPPQLTEQIKGLRRSFATEMGFVVPPIRIQDNIHLPSEEYEIKLKEITVASGFIKPGKLLVMSPAGGLPAIAGEKTKEPAFGLPAVWVPQTDKTKAIGMGCTVVDDASVIITHLSEIIRQNLPDLLTYVATQKLLDDLPREQQKLVNDLIPSQVSLSTVQRVLQALLAERISIRDLPTILESIQEACSLNIKGVQPITSHVRIRLCRQICDSLTGPDGYIPIVSLSPQWENDFMKNVVGPEGNKHLVMPPTMLTQFVETLRKTFNKLSENGEIPAIVVASPIREAMHTIVERIRPSVPVLSQAEIYPRARIRTVGTIS